MVKYSHQELMDIVPETMREVFTVLNGSNLCFELETIWREGGDAKWDLLSALDDVVGDIRDPVEAALWVVQITQLKECIHQLWPNTKRRKNS